MEKSVRVLRLHLKRQWWEQIKSGQKLEEYRLVTPYWQKRLKGREYDEVHILLGYPKSGDQEKVLVRRWAGYSERTLVHEEFGPDPVSVFAIDVSVIHEKK